MRTAFIQLCRHGDIVSALPMMKAEHDAGNDVSCLVASNFAGIFDGVSYVSPIIHDTNERDVDGGMARAKQMGFEKIIDTQVIGNPRRPVPESENFITWQWQFGGRLPEFHKLSLIFDRRSPEREADAVRQLIPPLVGDNRPILLYALHGHSSPFYQFAQFEKWLLANCSNVYRCVDIGKCKLHRPYDLLGLYEKATVLLTIDTMHAHLSYATKTPTIVLSKPDNRWYWSEPREHWVGHLDYNQALQREGQDKLRLILNDMDWTTGRLIRGAAQVERERIWHVIDWYCDPAQDNRRMLNARLTWEKVRDDDRHWDLVFHETCRHAKRSSRDIGDTRKLPLINDVFDYGVEHVAGDGIVVWTNSDICLTPDAAAIIRRKMAGRPCGYCRRVDVPDASQPVPRAHLIGQPANPGTDLFAFRKSWWNSVRDSLPPMYMGAEGFDFVLRHKMKQAWADCQIDSAIAYHEKHPPAWMDLDKINAMPAQKHNRKVCAEWALASGLAKAIYEPSQSRFLFKPDGTY